MQNPAPPHKQGAVLYIAPLVCAQLGAATHRQKLELEEEEHDAVDVYSSLYNNLLALVMVAQKQPGG